MPLPLCTAPLLAGSGASLTPEPLVRLVGNCTWKYRPFRVSANCYAGRPVQHMFIMAFWFEYRLFNRETTAAFGSSGFRGRLDIISELECSSERRGEAWERGAGLWKPGGDKRTEDCDTREMQNASRCLSLVWGKCWTRAATSWCLRGPTGLSLQVQLHFGDVGREGVGWLPCGCFDESIRGTRRLGLKMPRRRLTSEQINSLHWPRGDFSNFRIWSTFSLQRGDSSERLHFRRWV